MHFLDSQRPWGNFRQFTLNEPTTVKIITVNPNAELSLQYHHNRSEFWRIIGGGGQITIGEIEHEATVGEEFTVAVGEPHRMTAGPDGMQVLEIASGVFDEEDIIRLADNYGRA